MPGLRDIVSERDVVLQMRPEDLAQILLSLVRPHIQNGIFTIGPVGQVQSGRGYIHFGYVDGNDPDVERATAEAWAWMERNGLILPAPGINGAHGFKMLSREAEKIANSQADFSHLRDLANFPKTMLHPAIADKVYAALARKDLDEAVLVAFRAVEEAVRARSCSATAARMWSVRRVACGLSQATNSTPESIMVAMNATFRESRSSLAMTNRALCFRQAARAFCSSGRSLRLPVSTSVCSAIRMPPMPAR
jgi:hypothetical protein